MSGCWPRGLTPDEPRIRSGRGVRRVIVRGLRDA
jgi:hypothetical protein